MAEIISIKDSLNEGRVKINDEFSNIKENVIDFIGKGEITPDKTSFVRSGKNLFNKNNLIEGRVGSTGNIVIDEVNKTADYEFIEASTVYFTNKTVFVAQYDKEKLFLKYDFITAGSTLQTVYNAYYVRISTNNENIDNLQFEKGTIGTQYEPFYRTLRDVEFKQIHDAIKSDVKDKTFPSISARIDEVEQELIDLQPDDYEPVNDETAIQVFVGAMNDKVTLLGGENPTFRNATGLFEAGQVTSAKDLTLITRYAAGIPKLNSVWGARTYNVNIKGPNERVIAIETSVTSSSFENDYLILGGKTGTLGVIRNLTLVAKHKETGNVLAGTILKSDIDRFDAMKSMFDECVKIIDGEPSTDFSVEAEGGCAILLPENPSLYSNAPLEELILKTESIRQSPASVTKMLSAVVAIENIDNLNEIITFKESDMKEDTLEFYEGDKITIKDALYLMMLHSHNSSAVALSRTIGQKIVRTRGYAF